MTGQGRKRPGSPDPIYRAWRDGRDWCLQVSGRTYRVFSRRKDLMDYVHAAERRRVGAGGEQVEIVWEV